MKWIDSTDLRNWANRRNCQESLPHLVRKLIRATCNSIQDIKFPSGENILFGGWDGILEVSEETEYLPHGISLWEFGANKDPKGKADSEYEKRTVNPLGFNPAESTFIFVTPRLWQNGEDWIIDKKKDGIWKDIKVFNAEILEEWIEVAPTVGAWLAKHIGKYPEGGIQPSDDFWEEWISGNKFKLNAEILLGGRKAEQERVVALIQHPSINAVQGISREESLAFILSCFKSIPDKEEDFFSRSIIVENSESFRELVVHHRPLILIPRFEDDGIFNRAVQKGHTVIVPLGADSAANWSEKIVLPQIERDSFVSALVQSGMTKEFAERFSKESARNISILRRQLEFTRTLPVWALPESVAEIIPALVVGRWDENFESDKNVIAEIAGDTYENYSKKLTRWLHTADSPIVKIGSTWRLTSPFDAWTNASINITRNDFVSLHKSVIKIFCELNPVFELAPEQRHMASFYGKQRKFSGWIREGVMQSLILTAVFGDKLKFDLPSSAQLWVDNVIKEVLSTPNAELWKSFEATLPLIAEASPAAFLDAVEFHLTSAKSPIFVLFEEEKGFLTAHSYHTGLLWALENLAWFPECLSRSSLILAKLSSIDPGGSLSNRPINSLSSIFKSWRYQTLAPFEERMQVLKLIAQREPPIAWTILIRMLPESMRGIAFPTHKTRWRLFELETEKPVSWSEIQNTHSAVIDILLSIFDFTEVKLSQLIEESDKLTHEDREKVLSFADEVLPKVSHVMHEAWHGCRRILHQHRSHPTAPWALPESELVGFERLYEVLTPNDEIEKTVWLFNEHWPKFTQGFIHKRRSHREQESIIREKRIEGLNAIYSQHGLERIIELSEKVTEPGILGDTLAFITTTDEETIRLCQLLAREKSQLRFIQSFFYRKSFLNDLDWIFNVFEKLKSLEFDSGSLSNLLVPIPQSQKLWDFIELAGGEVVEKYWRNIYPNFYTENLDEKIFGVQKLIEHKRFLSAIHVCSHYAEEMPTDLIVTVLQKGGTEKADEEVRFDDYEINQLFETIDKREDVEINTFIQLEWLYLPLLGSYGNSHKPKRLHSEISKNAGFFVDVLKWIYKPDDDSRVEAEDKNITDEQRQARASQAYELLGSWKDIPGVTELGEINHDFLKDWINEARDLGDKCGRLEAADIYIGQVLAQYPEEPEKIWPPDEICDVIETLNSDCINRNFSSATFNKRGSSSRGAFDGGDIERAKATYFRNLASAHRNRYPTVTRIFQNLAIGYEEDAIRMDERAARDRLEY